MSEPERRNPGVTLCYWIILIIVRGKGEDNEGVCRQQTEWTTDKHRLQSFLELLIQSLKGTNSSQATQVMRAADFFINQQKETTAIQRAFLVQHLSKRHPVISHYNLVSHPLKT